MPELVMAEFASLPPLCDALRWMRGEGYRSFNAFTPYPAKEVDHAMGLTRSRLPRLVLAGGLTGATVGYLIQFYTKAVDYPINVGGRPDNAIPAFVPITFETAILFAALSTFFGLLWLCRLPRLWHPVFEVEGFERTSVDRFWLCVDSKDPRFAFDSLREKLETLGALRIVSVPVTSTGEASGYPPPEGGAT
jgi:hypothetical protein